ncbi:membrane metallo-endopeptidase-like 1 [Stomoxys calcitrans]|uniref:membrane metallo-endopeptidase-like 1 n=1 Tax=Stomoxys calcitrans TaxID=35570 RepID=UPI0027E37716|nr:membrane metallo-endopeptidase-like 1 [Stomoxys calcitrans]
MLLKIPQIIFALILACIPSHAAATMQEIFAARQAKSLEILKYMNQSINPCENFFEFTCGNWKTHHPTSLLQTKTSAFTMAIADFKKYLPQMLNNFEYSDTVAERKAKYFYGSCLHSGPLKKHGERLKQIIDTVLKMPALEGDEWQEKNFDWLATVAEISHRYGINIILGFELKLNIKDHTAYDIWLTKQRFPSGLSQSLSMQLQTYLAMTEPQAEAVALAFANLEKMLKNFPTGHSAAVDIEELHGRYYPALDIKKLLRISLGFEPQGNITYEENFMKFIVTLLQGVSKKAMANYIYLSLFRELMRQLPPNPSMAPAQCLQKVEENFKDIISFTTYRKFNLSETEEKVTQVWLKIQENLQLLLESSHLKWFDDEAREYALEKLHWLKMVVPSYREIDLNSKYASLNVSLQQSFLENLLALHSFKAGQNRKSLLQLSHHIDDVLNMNTLLYMPLSNAIVTPVSVLLNEYFYSQQNPHVLNLARLGFIMGHEVLHGFTGIGRKFNKLGNYIGDWDEDIEMEFKQRRLCLYHQYHNYTFGGVNLPQDITQSENAADIGGIILAYHTYLQWHEDKQRTTEELYMETLPNLPYTLDQIFFIYYAQTWCADTFEPLRAKAAASDKHSPDEFRTWAPLTNIQAFSQAFQCPLGSFMNPRQKCDFF